MLTTVAKTINICIVKLSTFMTFKYFSKIICKVSGKFPFQFVTYLKHRYHYYVFSKKKILTLVDTLACHDPYLLKIYKLFWFRIMSLFSDIIYLSSFSLKAVVLHFFLNFLSFSFFFKLKKIVVFSCGNLLSVVSACCISFGCLFTAIFFFSFFSNFFVQVTTFNVLQLCWFH